MRDASYINDLWSVGGPFSGPGGKPHTRVTVQRPWSTSDPVVRDGDEDHVIHPTWQHAGSSRSRGVPMRWYQKFDDSQIEEELPNLKSVSIDRSIESDAATCNITIYNQWMYENGAVPDGHWIEGNRHLSGYFTPTRGVYPDANIRWGQTTNEWEDSLVPNAVLRTYQGYGGHNKTLDECLDDGNLILTGVWLVDEVQVQTNGELDIRCRDMAKLLVEQHLFPPLIPSEKYPLTYYRWVYDSFKVKAAAVKKTVTTTTRIAVGRKRCVFRTSSVDAWYPGHTSTGGFVLHGHKGSQSIDGSTATYWLGEGNSGPDRPFAVNWIEYTCGEDMNAVYVQPWGGNYTMYVSVMVGGVWQGSATVPYDYTPLIGHQPQVVDTNADIHYVASFGVPWERAREYVLPRVYQKAERVRISFRHLTDSGIGPWRYRAGVRNFQIRATAAAGSITTTKTQIFTPFFWAAASLRNPENLNAEGYITASQMGQVDAFGDCRVKTRNTVSPGDDDSSAWVSWTELTPDGGGYWVLRGDGRIAAFGNAQSYGSPHADGVGKSASNPALPDAVYAAERFGGPWGNMARTPTGAGYWVVSGDGRIRAYGDATAFADVTAGEIGSSVVAGGNSLVSNPTDDDHGLFLAIKDGTVVVRGAATSYGDYTEPDELVTVVPTIAGDGYWMMSGSGRVQVRGAATDYGQVANPSTTDPGLIYDQLLAVPADDGYWLMRGPGQITAFGNANSKYGSPVPGTTGQIRSDGNYLDYADIIKDLALWSGFLLFDADIAPNNPASVHGNIESTGAFSPESLPDDLFDKRPVIDAMTQLKETVGYLLFVDDAGGLRFESPNFWTFGNVVQETGMRDMNIPEIDERVNLTDYGTSRNDESLRSLIIISSDDPNEAGDTTVTTKIVPQTASGLRGLMKPAMWVNGWFQDDEEQEIMAELISLHIWFAQRLGQVSCAANPAIQINDQVRIYERQTSEVFMHYVRGVNTTHDLDSGRYLMTLTTHWLGTGEDWAITDQPEFLEDEDHFVVSQSLVEFLRDNANRSGSTAGQDSPFLLGFSNEVDPSYKAVDPDGPDGPIDQGAGPE